MLVMVLAVTFFAASVAVLAQTMADWQGPTDQPPQGNPPGFIFNTDQLKNAQFNISGPIKIQGKIIVAEGTADEIIVGQGAIKTPQICLPPYDAASCVSSWAGVVGGGDSFWIDQGAYIYDANTAQPGSLGLRVYDDGKSQFHFLNDWVEIYPAYTEGFGGTGTGEGDAMVIKWGDDNNDVLKFVNNLNYLTSGNDQEVMTLTRNGVGIGTAAPNRTLHLANSAGNAEMDIQSGGKNYWAIYHDQGSEDLRFWNADATDMAGNVMTLKNSGKVSIGKTDGPGTLTVYNSNSTDYGLYLDDQNDTDYGSSHDSTKLTMDANRTWFTGITDNYIDTKFYIQARGRAASAPTVVNDYQPYSQYLPTALAFGWKDDTDYLTEPQYKSEHDLLLLVADRLISATSVNYGSAILNGSLWLRPIPTTDKPKDNEGVMYYDTTSHKFRCYQGSGGSAGWVDCVGAAGTALPSGTTNQTLRSNGTSWVASSSLWNSTAGVSIATTKDPRGSKLEVGGGILSSGVGARLQVASSDGVDPAASPVWVIDNYFDLSASMNNDFRIYAQPNVNTAAENWNLKSLVVKQSGKVGIGTTNPNKQLHIFADGTTLTDNAEIDLQSVGTGINNHWGIYVNRGVVGSADYNSFRIWGTGTGGSDRLSILSNGNVGIGTNNPVQKMDVGGNILFNGDLLNNLYYSGGWKYKGNGVGWAWQTTNGGNFDIWSAPANANGAGAPASLNLRMTVANSSGNVGIGTTNPQDKLEVTGNITSRLDGGPSSGPVLKLKNLTGYGIGSVDFYTYNGQTVPSARWQAADVGGYTADQILYTSSGGSPNQPLVARLTVKGLSGNVGIGTTNPTQKLDVSGNIRANGYISSTGMAGITTDMVLKNYDGTDCELGIQNGLIVYANGCKNIPK